MDGDKEQIVKATAEAVRRQERRTYWAIIAGFVVCAAILILFGLFALIRIETLIHENRQATIDSRAAVTRIEGRQEQILGRLSDLIVAENRSTQRIIIAGDRRAQRVLRELTRDLAGAERRVTRALHNLRVRLAGGG